MLVTTFSHRQVFHPVVLHKSYHRLSLRTAGESIATSPITWFERPADGIRKLVEEPGRLLSERKEACMGGSTS
jgi:hypothetical protein